MSELDSLNLSDPALAALAEVLTLGSFEAAAARLSVTPSAISQRIKGLETRIGTALVRRGSPCTGTPAGLRLVRHYQDVRLLEQELSRDMGRDSAPARLAIALNADSLATWFLPALTGLPHLFDLVIDDQSHSADWLRRGEVVAAVTADARAVTGCDIHPLGHLDYRATASPAYVAQHFPNGITSEALSRAPALTFNTKDKLQTDWAQAVTGKRPHLPTHLMASSHAFVEATLIGLGWGMNPAHLVDGLIAEGRLVDLSPEVPLSTPLYWQTNHLLARQLAPLTAAVRKQGKATLRPIK